MTKIPEWAYSRVFDEVKKEIGSTTDKYCFANPQDWPCSRAFARYIAGHEEPPVDPDLLKAREIAASCYYDEGYRKSLLGGEWDNSSAVVRARSEEHTYELQSLMRISYAVL